MNLIQQILRHNAEFVARRKYEAYRTDRFPNKKLVLLTCMDTRLVELLPRAMNLRNGDVKVIKNAGAIVSHPYGSVMRSILVAVYELRAAEVAVVGHRDCGMTHLDCASILDKARARGIGDDVIDSISAGGVDLPAWLRGFECVEDAVRQSVTLIRRHPLLPRDVPVHGMVICPETGKLDLVVDGYTLNV